MRKVLMLVMFVLCLGIGSLAMAWQDPCVLQDYDFIMSGDYVLMDFTDDNNGFGPRPDCAGDVTVICPDNRECVVPYGVWGDTLVIGQNLYNMNFTLIDDNRLVPQNNADWEEVLARNGCSTLEPNEPDEPVCGSDHLDLCSNQTTCEVVGGHWCNVACQAGECASACPECQECPELDCANCNSTCPECSECNVTVPDETKPFVCPLIGNTYRFDTPDISYSLSNFRCEVGPGCRGTCDLQYGNFDTGPSYIQHLSFSCQKNGITILGLPCGINNGNLKVLGVNTTGYHHYCIGEVTYCFPDKKMVITFEAE